MFAGPLGDIPGQIALLRSPETVGSNGDTSKERCASKSPDSSAPYGNFIEEFLELLLDKALEAPGEASRAVSEEKAFACDAPGGTSQSERDSEGCKEGSVPLGKRHQPEADRPPEPLIKVTSLVNCTLVLPVQFLASKAEVFAHF